MRTVQFSLGELYHVYNRGVDKRSIFKDSRDFKRFVLCLRMLNQEETIKSFHLLLKEEKEVLRKCHTFKKPLVRFHTYCINQNHFHFLLEPLQEGGVQKFMHRVGTSYTKYFNERHKRTGSLFQGTYKAVHVDTHAYFMHISSYITWNNNIHPGLNKKWLEEMNYSARGEITNYKTSNQIADASLILSQYKSPALFLSNAKHIAQKTAEMRDSIKAYKTLCID